MKNLYISVLFTIRTFSRETGIETGIDIVAWALVSRPLFLNQSKGKPGKVLSVEK